MKNEFEAAIAANERAEEHAREIQQTRVGGLGGSDAALVYKIGMNGLAALTATGSKRLAIMCGLQEPDTWKGNAYTNAGHEFEEYAADFLPFGEYGCEREKLMMKNLARNFKTFAHADFAAGALRREIVECKFVQDSTAAVMQKYMPQLQWYYMLGADIVYLYHGVGTAEPFSVDDASLTVINRDEQMINILLNGIQTLDKALTDGWKPEAQDKVGYADVPNIVQRAFDKLSETKAKEAELKLIKDEVAGIIKTYMEDFAITSIVLPGDIKHTVLYVKKQTRIAFDADKFLREHPEFDRPEYYKKTTVKASITFK